MTSLPRSYFDDLYRARVDPWEFRTRPYERAKYAATVAALPRSRYASALELGCSIGELTALLAPLADQLTAVDTSAVALARARRRCRKYPSVRFVQAHLPGGPWMAAFDLVVISEFLYYFDVADLATVADRVHACCSPTTDVVLVHWTGETNYPLTADDAVAAFTANRFRSSHQQRTAHYRLDVLAPIY